MSRDCCVRNAYANDGLVESVEIQKADYHPFHKPWKSLRDSHIYTGSAMTPYTQA